MTTTPEQKLAQSAEDKAVVNIKAIENGFTVRIESKTYAFPTIEETLSFIKARFVSLGKK